MLLCKYGSRHKENNLLAVLHCFECCTQSYLGLTEAYIAADKPVHDAVALHISLDRLYGMQLILGFFIGKELLELPLPDRVMAVLKALAVQAFRIKLYELSCYIIDCFNCALSGLGPFRSVELVELRRLCRAVCVLLYEIQLGCRQIELAAVRIFKLYIILAAAVSDYMLKASVYAYSVILMHHIIAAVQLA